MAEKKTRGKQKIEIKKLENENDRMITFSKRRSGINKKLSELVTCCGVEAGFLVFSGAGKPHAFGHPGFESIAARFLNGNVQEKDVTKPLVKAHKRVQVDELNKQYSLLTESLKAADRHSKTLKQLEQQGRNLEEAWWQIPIRELGPEELIKLYELYQDLHESLSSKILQRQKEVQP